MNIAISFLLYTFAILTFIKGFEIYKRDYDVIHKKQYILYSITAFLSSVWSFGYAMLWIQTDPEMARAWRAFGMIGVLLLFDFVTEFMVQWLEGAGLFKLYVRVFSALAVFLWPFLIGEESVAFYRHETLGMTYRFSPNIWNTLYNAYSVIVGINLFLMCFYILKQSKRRKMRAIIRRIMICLIVVMLGMVFDTLLPIFGYDALPGSTLTQGIGVLMVSGVLDFQRKSEITVENISEFVYSSVNTPVLIYDEKGKFRIANNGAKDFFVGYSKDIEQKKINEIFDFRDTDFQFADKKMTLEAECKLNKRYCQVEISKIFDEYHDVIGCIVVLNDLTEKRDIIQRLQTSEHEADMANHAKSNFLARMSHEIRTPINGVIGMNEMILQKSTDEQIINYASMVKLSAHNLMELINDILDISKIEANHMVVENSIYSFKKLLKEVLLQGYVKSKEKGIDFGIEIKESIPETLNGDEKKLRQIISNLISNALKYTKEGFVHIIAEGIWKDEKYFIKIIVKDTGIGIAEENFDKIFEAFERIDYQKHQGIEGTGLGLAIVKSLLEIMEGEVTVRSEYGKGSEFEIIVPQKPVSEKSFDCIEMEGTDETEDGAQRISLSIPGKRILVVDDNEINRIVASELLAYTEAEIDTAESGKECLKLVTTNCYDFILLDHIMPEMDGIQVLQELRKIPDNNSKNAKIIVLTANAIQGARENYLSKGFDDYLSKPIDMTEVEKVLGKYLS